MTWRSALLGLAGAVGICGVTFLNDRVLKGTFLIGNNMPVAVYGTLIVFVVLVNPLLRRLALSGREIAVVMALTLAACCIPSSGLFRTFTDVLVLPRHFEKTEPGWAGGSCVLSDDDVADWPAFLRALEAAGAGDGPARSVWLGLTEELRDRIVRESGQPSVELRADLREGLDALVRRRSWPAVEDLRRLDLPTHVERLAETSADELSDQDVDILGRTTLEVLFAGHIEPRRVGILEEVPEGLLVEAGRDEEHVVGDFVQGQGVGTGHISFDSVPWGAWVRPLSFWVPLVLVLLAAVVCLSVVVHRQWSQHELLPYPIALFADSLLPDGNGVAGARASVFRSSFFWISAGVVLAIHLNNYLFHWSPQYLSLIPTSFDFGSLRPLFPTLVRGGAGFLFNPKIYFVVIGIAYFTATDVSLSFAVGPVLWALVVGIFAGYGISLQAAAEGTGYWMSAAPRTFIVFGACLGAFLVLAYAGRRFYASVALRAFGRPAADDVRAVEIWAFRALTVLTLLFVLMLAFGADIGIPYALLYTAIAFIGFVVTARVIAETGLFHIQIMVFPCIIMWGLFGARMIGVKALLIMQIVSIVLFIDPRESLMPFMVNSLKLLERRGASLGKPAALAVLAIVLGLAVVLPVTLYVQYDQGLTHDYWAEQMVPKMPFDNAVSLRYKYEAQGLRTSTGRATDEEARFKPIAICVYALLAGTVLVLAFTVARLRLPWWPLHPLMFVLWATNHAKLFAVSFFIGWAVKALVVKYGGNKIFGRVKPLMVGLIAGEVLGALVPCVAGAIYYMVTGEPPKAFHVLPG